MPSSTISNSSSLPTSAIINTPSTSETPSSSKHQALPTTLTTTTTTASASHSFDRHCDPYKDLTLAPTTTPDSTVHIIVGTESHDDRGHGRGSEYLCPERFTVHRDLLCYFSPYFRTLLRSRDPVTKRIPNTDVVSKSEREQLFPSFRLDLES